MGVASPHAYRRRRRRKRRVNPLTLNLWNRDRGNNFPKEKALLFMVRQKAKKLFGGVLRVVGSLLSRSSSVGVGSVRPLSSSVVVSSWLRFCLSCLPFRWVAVRLALRSCFLSACRSSGVVRVVCPSCRRPSSFGRSPVGVGVGLSPLLPQPIVSVVSASRNKQKQKSR